MFKQENRIIVNTSNLRSLLAPLSSLLTRYCGYMVSHWVGNWKPARAFQLELSWWQFGSSQRRTEVIPVTSPGPSSLPRLPRLRWAGLKRRRQTSSLHFNVRRRSDLSQKGSSPKPNVSQPSQPPQWSKPPPSCSSSLHLHRQQHTQPKAESRWRSQHRCLIKVPPWRDSHLLHVLLDKEWSEQHVSSFNVLMWSPEKTCGGMQRHCSAQLSYQVPSTADF